MSQLAINQTTKTAESTITTASQWANISKLGGWASLLQLACVLASAIVLSIVGLEPTTAAEYFEAFQMNRLVGILRLDFPTLLLLCLFYLTAFGIFAGLRDSHGAYAALGAALIYVGTTLGIANHSAFSMIRLTDLYAAATTAAQQEQLLVVGEAMVASDMWNSTAGFLAGIFLQGSLVFLSTLMLRSKNFSKWTAYTGILGNGFDLAHVFVALFAPAMASTLLYISGPFYLAWFILLGRDLIKVGHKIAGAPSKSLVF
ncbi:MAG: hypothetical protein PVF74_12050 [Anaerolineales bacterium]